MDKLILEKLNEIGKLLMVAQQRVEYLQKIFYIKIKRNRKASGLEDSTSENRTDDD